MAPTAAAYAPKQHIIPFYPCPCHHHTHHCRYEQELKMQDGDVSYLAPEYKQVLDRADKIQHEYKVRRGQGGYTGDTGAGGRGGLDAASSA